MNDNRRDFLTAALAGACGSLLPAAARAAEWSPNRPIELLVSFPPGGTADTLARYVAKRLHESHKWVVVVQNRPGGGGVLMHRALQAARADGHTIGFCASYELTYPSQERGAAPFQVDDFTYLGGLARSPHCLVARPEAGLDSIEKIRALGRQKGSVSIGVASPFDWLAPRLGADLGIPTIGVPFKGGAEMMQQVMSGNLDLSWSAGSHAPLEKAGKVKVVLALTRERLPANPTVPTALESGSKLVVESQFLVVGSRGLPAAESAALTRALGEIMADPGMRADVASRGLIPAFMDGGQLRQSIQADLVLARGIEPAASPR